jgi:hypothetical protein
MKRPRYVIAASVPTGNRITRFHGYEEGSVASLLMHPPTFRRGGFDVSVLDAVRPGPEDSLEVGGDRKLLRLYQDGTVILRVAADQEFLGWGVEQRDFVRFPRLNPVAVAELHASFAHFYGEILRRLKHSTAHVTVKLAISNGSSGSWRLYLTELPSLRNIDPYTVTPYPLQQDPAEETVELAADQLTTAPNRAGYDLLRAFCSMFDLPEDRIPFTRQGSTGPEVDVEKIASLRS